MEENKQTTKEEMLKNQKSAWDIRPYLAIGLTAIIVILVCISIFFLIYRYHGLALAFGKALNVLQPVLIGFIIAYLLNPVMIAFEKRLRKVFEKRNKTAKRKVSIKKQRMAARGLSVTFAMAIFLVIIAILLILMIPQLVLSVEDLISTMGDKVDSLMNLINHFAKQGGTVESWFASFSQEITGYITKWLQNAIKDTEFISTVSNGVFSVVKGLFNVVIGLIISVYILLKKESFIGQTKKLIYAIFKPRRANIVMEVLRKSNSIFGGFFIGKIIDSIIIGFIAFACLWILKMPYVVLVSVIIGVTNVIPVFGPYIGAIPCAILIFLVNPWQGLYFIIFILILQQVDGNIIGPKILGDSTGLSPFWVIFAILVFGGLFGVIGMLFGVPIFAVIYYIIKRLAEHFLKKDEMPTETVTYIHLDTINAETKEVTFNSEEPTVNPTIQKAKFWKHIKKKNKSE